MSGNPAKHIDLQSAADELGVHYQTAYRWVRTGRLPAVVVAGRYVLERADLEALRSARSKPAVPAAPSAMRLDRAGLALYDRLLEGDEAAATKLVLRLVSEGSPIVEVIQEVIVPPLVRIGQRWHDGELTIWVEHRASAIIDRILGALAPNPRGRRRGTAMVAALAGDFHSLPTTMAAVALRDDNWQVHHLGANMPPSEIEQFCREHAVTIAVLTVTNPEVAAAADSAAERLHAAGTPAIVGGGGRSLAELIELARSAASSRQREAT